MGLATDSINTDGHGGIARATRRGAGTAAGCIMGSIGRSKAVGVGGVIRHSRQQGDARGRDENNSSSEGHPGGDSAARGGGGVACSASSSFKGSNGGGVASYLLV